MTEQSDLAYRLGCEIFRDNAVELAEWAAERLVNRWDARGGYYTLESGAVQRTTRKEGQPYWSPTNEALIKHFGVSGDPAELVGLHSTSASNTSKWLAIDIDAHTDDASKTENEECATQIALSARSLGFRPLVVGSDGRGGIHLYIFFREPVDTALVYALGQDLLRDCPTTHAPPETFPKQAAIRAGGYGNFIRVFGHHHKRRYVSEEWAWEIGHWVPLEAKCVLDVEGDDVSLLEQYRPQSELAGAAAPANGGPAAPNEGRLAPATLVFMREGAPVGQQQNNKLFAAAADLCGNGYQLEDAIRWLEGALTRIGELEDADKVRGTIERAFSQERGPALPPPGGIDIDIPYPERAAGGAAAGRPPRGGAGGGEGGDNSISNATAVGEGRGAALLVKTMDEISTRVFEVKAGFPKSVNGLLFAVRPGGGGGPLPNPRDILYLDSTDKLFGWLRSNNDVMWYSPSARGVNPATESPCTPISRGELFSSLSTYTDNVDGIEALPHYPRRDATFYLPSRPPPPDAGVLNGLIDRFNAETEEDRALLTAMLLTPGWGGPPGGRPAFLLTSDYGRGVGKTITAQFIADIWGGLITVDQKEPWEAARKRLLCDDALSKRVVLVDNLTTRRCGAGLVEAITSSVVDGWRPYYGQFSRPNYLTWVFTANVPSVSQDLVERAITIKIGEQKHSTEFSSWISNYIKDHRAVLISTLLARLEGEDRSTISPAYADRWAPWQAGVLQKVEGGDRLVRLYTDRRGAIDSDLEEGQEMLAAVREAIRVQFFKPDAVRLEFDGLTLAHILKDAGLVRHNAQAVWVSRVVNQARSCDPDLAARLTPHKNHGARLWWWNGPESCREDDRVAFRYRTIL